METNMRIIRSRVVGKKWRALFKDGSHTDFGDSTMEDYTQHKDKDRRSNYQRRHSKDLLTGDPHRAGFLSYYLLWGNSTSLEENIRAYKRKFGDL